MGLLPLPGVSVAYDLGSLTQQIKEEIVRSTTTDNDRIWRAIIDTMDFHKHRRLFFNETTGTITAVVGQADYTRNAWGTATATNYPYDVLVPDVLYVTESTTVFDPIPQRPAEVVYTMRNSSTAQGYPGFWAFHHDTILLDRYAHSAFTINLLYVADLGVPYYAYESNAWAFYEPDGTSLASTYSTDWFVEGQEVLRFGAQARLARWQKDDKEAYRCFQWEQKALDALTNRSRASRGLILSTPWD